jgi:disulfide bond formation protein DsbB
VNRIERVNRETAGIAFGAVAIACLLQHAWHLQPCTMCILQRYAFLFIGMLALCRMKANGSTAVALRAVTNFFALGGVAASLKIQWAISVPSSSCGHDAIAAFLNGLPWAKAVPALFKATGVCGDYVPPVLHLQFHVWSLLFFSLISLVTLYTGHQMKKGVSAARPA